MKLKTCYTTLLAALICGLMPFAAGAQDSRGGFDMESSTKDPVKQDQDNLPGGENSEIRSNTKSLTPPSGAEPVVVRDAEIKNSKPAVKTEKAQQKEPEKSKKEEDPLSFNFLYYIIERFKLTDIIE